MFKGNLSLKKGSNEVAGIALCSEGATDQVNWRATLVADMIAKIEPPLGGGSTFVPKREC